MIGSTSLFDSNGPTSPFLELLDLFGVKHDGTLAGIRDATQSAWYEAGKLRAEITEKHGDKRLAAMRLFYELGFVEEVQASRMHYLHALVLGSTIVAVRKRLAFLRKQWWNGVRFENIYLLGSERPLMPDKESPSVLFNANNEELPFKADPASVSAPTNEAEMMRFVFETTASEFPWGDVPMTLVTTKVEGRNANTVDTLREWNALSVMGGQCLVVSSQPFVAFQGLVARKYISHRHDLVDCIGYAGNIAIPVTTYLDNVAKIVFELASI